jgi:hypothetical protein
MPRYPLVLLFLGQWTKPVSAGGSGVKINNTFILVIPMMQGRKVKKVYMFYKKLVVTVFVGVLVLC